MKQADEAMSRTDELRKAGAKKLGGAGNHPFVKWNDSHAYVEGDFLRLWESNFGWCATLEVRAVSDDLEAKMDKESPATVIQPGDVVNVSLNYTTLRDALRDEHIGHAIHVAFSGWERSKAGSKYRLFEIYDLGASEVERSDEVTQEELEEGDDLPF